MKAILLLIAVLLVGCNVKPEGIPCVITNVVVIHSAMDGHAETSLRCEDDELVTEYELIGKPGDTVCTNGTGRYEVCKQRRQP